MSFRLLKSAILEPFQKPYLLVWAFTYSGLIYLLNLQASLYDIGNPRWVLTMAGIILLSPFFNGGFILLLRAGYSGQRLGFVEAIAQVVPAYGSLVLGQVLVSLIVGIGLMFFVLPGIYFGLRLIFYKQELLIAGKRGTEALKMSMVRTRQPGLKQVLFLYLSIAYLPVALSTAAAFFLPVSLLWDVLAVFSSALVFAWSNILVTRIYLQLSTKAPLGIAV
jgi:hypothetical protein